MPGSNSAVNNLIFGLSIAGSAQAEADNANRRAGDAENRAMLAEIELSGQSTDSDLQLRLDIANRREKVAQNAADIYQRQLAEMKEAMAEWLHSNEAFKRLSKQYGKKMDISPEQQKKDFSQHVIDIASEDHVFSKTAVGERAQTLIAGPKP